jgi:hypothetical protein
MLVAAEFLGCWMTLAVITCALWVWVARNERDRCRKAVWRIKTTNGLTRRT